MPHVGASAIVATFADPMAFCSGRDFAAWIGVVPRKTRPAASRSSGRSRIRATAMCGAFSSLALTRSCATASRTLKNIPGSRNCWRDDPKAEW
jgi:transposase